MIELLVVVGGKVVVMIIRIVGLILDFEMGITWVFFEAF